MDNTFNIVNLFLDSARKYPDKVAIIHKNKAISFSEFEKQIKDTSNYFLNKGISKGDRVLIFVPMSIDLYRIVLALFNIGATAVFLDEWVSKKRMEECCKVAQCKAFVGILKAKVFSFFSSELRKIPIKLGVKYNHVAPFSNKDILKTEVNGNDTALITFTTGTTGIPKAAKRTHQFLREQFFALIDKIDAKPEDIDMPVLPIVLLINLGVGSTSVIAEFKASKPASLNEEKIIKQITQYKVSRIVASPFFVKQIANKIISNKLSVGSLKKIFTGGAPVFPYEAEVYNKAFPGAQVEVVYGSTEAEPISSINVKELIKEKENILQKGLKVGIPYHKIECKIIKIQQGAISCADENELNALVVLPSQIGEIIVSGSHVLREYFNNDEALKQNKIFIGNKCWHRTGDSGYMDEAGVLYLTGRCNTLISLEDKVVATFIYENYFQSIDGVEIGTIMKINEELLAIIEMGDDSRKEYIRNNISLLDIKFDMIKFISKIPRDLRHNSKIDYGLLKKKLG